MRLHLRAKPFAFDAGQLQISHQGHPFLVLGMHPSDQKGDSDGGNDGQQELDHLEQYLERGYFVLDSNFQTEEQAESAHTDQSKHPTRFSFVDHLWPFCAAHL